MPWRPWVCSPRALALEDWSSPSSTRITPTKRENSPKSSSGRWRTFSRGRRSRRKLPVTHKNFALVLLCAASFMAVVDTTIVSIALPSMRRELGFSRADAPWILNGYALAFGGLLLLLGRAGDLYGRRQLFVAGLAVFAAASLVGRLSWEPWVLVVARFLQGVGAATLVPASLSLLTAIFAEGEERSEEHTSELQSRQYLVCRLLLEKKKTN